MKIRRYETPSDTEYMQDDKSVTIIVRPDIEDRINHEKTKAYQGPETAWHGAIHPFREGFIFAPAENRELRASVSPGTFVSEPEWMYSIFHPEDAERGFDPYSDLFSPGYFTISLNGGESADFTYEIKTQKASGHAALQPDSDKRISCAKPSMLIEDAMLKAMRSFIVKRGALKTVIAGYPWFLDWGRDTLICLRGIIAAGMRKEAGAILKQFGRFESKGTLPNMMCGDDDANRDTSDAPLWFCVACNDLIQLDGNDSFLHEDCGHRTIRDVLLSIIKNYIHGTPNGVRMDPDSGLIFSPAHFTWMDTNYPAGTPREGYPIEIQALWHAALSIPVEMEQSSEYMELAQKVRESTATYFRQSPDNAGWLSDCLHAARGQRAKEAVADDALRPNQLLAITLGAIRDKPTCASIIRACEELLVPGAIRSLADRPVNFALPVTHADTLLNDPLSPYWGRYSGDEDTRRKPAYHNGTAWTWIFPSYSESLFMTYGKEQRNAALSILSSSIEIINSGCVGHVPEIIDGDMPHTPRGCGAQAWGATELYRVIQKLTVI